MSNSAYLSASGEMFAGLLVNVETISFSQSAGSAAKANLYEGSDNSGKKILGVVLPVNSGFTIELPVGIRINSGLFAELNANQDINIQEGKGLGSWLHAVATGLLHTGTARIQGILVTNVTGADGSVVVHDSVAADNSKLTLLTEDDRSRWFPFHELYEMSAGIHLVLTNITEVTVFLA